MFQHITLDTIQYIQPSAFLGLSIKFLTVVSVELRQMPDITLLRQSLQYITVVCGINCSLNVGADHFSGSTMLKNIQIQKAGLIDIEWLVSLRRPAVSVLINDNKITTLAPIYGIRFERLSYLNLNHNYVSVVHIASLVMPQIRNLYFEDNQISHFNFARCEFNGSSPYYILVHMTGNPFNCCTHWRWLYSHLMVYHAEGLMTCGQREISLGNIGDIKCWDCKAKQWQPLIRLEDFASSAKPGAHESKI